MEDEAAISDDVSRPLPLHRQNPRSRFLTFGAYLRGDFLHGRSALVIYPPMRRNPRIPLGPQLAIDRSLFHSARAKDEPIGLQGVQNGHERHAGIVAGRARAGRESRVDGCASV
jgi:hypothetical protein